MLIYWSYNKVLVVVPSCYMSRNIHPEANLLTPTARMKWIKDRQMYWSHIFWYVSAQWDNLRNNAALQSGGFTAGTSVSFVRWQQVDQTVAATAAVDTSLHLMPLILCRWVPVMFSAVSITHYRAFLSGVRQEPCWFPDRMLSIALL